MTTPEPSAPRQRAEAALYRALHECERIGFVRSICLRECVDHLCAAGLPNHAERADDGADSLSITICWQWNGSWPAKAAPARGGALFGNAAGKSEKGRQVLLARSRTKILKRRAFSAIVTREASSRGLLRTGSAQTDRREHQRRIDEIREYVRTAAAGVTIGAIIVIFLAAFELTLALGLEHAEQVATEIGLFAAMIWAVARMIRIVRR